MIYLYLQTCSDGNEKLALMAMNTFLKDCKHQDHKVRGLAIRTLSNMKTPTALEFTQQMVPEMLRFIRNQGVVRFLYISEQHETSSFSNSFIRIWEHFLSGRDSICGLQ